MKAHQCYWKYVGYWDFLVRNLHKTRQKMPKLGLSRLGWGPGLVWMFWGAKTARLTARECWWVPHASLHVSPVSCSQGSQLLQLSPPSPRTDCTLYNDISHNTQHPSPLLSSPLLGGNIKITFLSHPREGDFTSKDKSILGSLQCTVSPWILCLCHDGNWMVYIDYCIDLFHNKASQTPHPPLHCCFLSFS